VKGFFLENWCNFIEKQDFNYSKFFLNKKDSELGLFNCNMYNRNYKIETALFTAKYIDLSNWRKNAKKFERREYEIHILDKNSNFDINGRPKQEYSFITYKSLELYKISNKGNWLRAELNNFLNHILLF
jgi:hypothetical protein